MSSLDLAEMKEIAQSRALGYAFFADLFFKEANEMFVERLREMRLRVMVMVLLLNRLPV